MMANFLIHKKWRKTRLFTSFNTVQHDVFVMVTDAFQDGDSGIPFRYRFDGKLSI